MLEIDKQNQYIVYYNTNDFLGTYPASKEIVLDYKNKIYPPTQKTMAVKPWMNA